MQQSTSRQTRRVAVFDFDGTCIGGQSGALFTTYLLLSRRMSLVRALRLGLWGARYKLHLPHRQDEARELVFGALRSLTAEEVDALMVRFHDEVLAPRYRPLALAEIARRRDEGCVTLLVSATFDVIAQVAGRYLGTDDTVATRMARDASGNYTGEVDGNVVVGEEKYLAAARWCDEHLGEGAWELAYAYGDHHTDAALFERAGEGFAVCPGKTLAVAARRHGWKVLDWSAKAAV